MLLPKCEDFSHARWACERADISNTARPDDRI
jgi:hypothetical protein